MKEKPYNGGQWTEARFNSFVKNALRNASMKWPPKYRVKKQAWKRRGVYECAGYKKKPHEAKAKEVFVDHIDPVIDPLCGFQTWDEVIKRMFCEDEGLQVLCKDCHDRKTKDEKEKKKNG